ncbi:LamG domain-containing protein [Candidatus Poribacteria bacterium]|nr:LamG domain-containing protein [Candidatus Poribacteria bacterium]
MRTRNWLILTTLIVTVYLTSVASAGLNDGLLIYLPFDERSGQTAADKSGNGNDAKLIDGATWKSNGGKIGGAVALDGAGGVVEDANGGDYINGLDAFSISVWVKSDSVGHDRGIIFGTDPDGGDHTFGLRYDAASWSTPGGTNLIKGGISTTGGGQAYEGKSDVQTTDWQHLVFTWKSGEKLALYIDGELDDDPTHNADGQVGTISGADKLLVGKGAKDNNGTSWHGLLDDVRIYDRALSEAEIAELASGVLAVEAGGKLATTWANLKQR